MSTAADLEREVIKRWPTAQPSRELLEELSAPTSDALDLLSLCLARSATRGARWATTVLENEVFVTVRDRLALRYDRVRADDAIQHVREQLLVGTPGLAAYSGRGSLLAWVMVIAARRLMALPVDDAEVLDSDVPLEDDVDLDMAVLRARYVGPFKRALARALAALERRERLLLRMHTVDGLSAEKIGAVFHVHRATATTWLTTAREHLREHALVFMQQESGISAVELGSIARAVQEFTDLSLPRLLAQKEQP